MNQLQRAWVWIRRIGHCRGFGVQSPSDYRFVRYVINEHWPYYAYQQLNDGRNWLTRKMGGLMMRIANWRQPTNIVDRLGGYTDYLEAGCRHAQVTTEPDGKVEMACIAVEDNGADSLLDRCDDDSVIIIEGIWREPRQWAHIAAHPRARVTFDLYYCGVVLTDTRQSPNHYIVNF